jgi:aspartate aminotransferase
VIDPGDEVLVFSPFWTPIRDLIAHCEGKTVLVRSGEARREGFRETLARHTTDRTRAIYYNTPQNPTGLVFTREEAEEVARFARERNLVVIADEAYEDLVYEGEHVSIASLEGMFERTITCYTLSKSYAMTGWRVGYAVAQEPWMTGLRKCLLYSTNGVSTPSQWAALAAFGLPEDFYEGIRAEYRLRRDLLVSGLNELGLTCDPPHGAFYAFPEVRGCFGPGRESSIEIAEYLLEEAAVAVVPGAAFGADDHIRLSFACSRATLAEGLERIATALAR